QVTTDAELVPSVIRFATDGSPVLVLYQGGCCEPDPVRDDRDGGRGILNAFRLVLAAPTGYVDKPNPSDGTDDVPADVVLSWRAGAYAQWHDVYLGTDFNDVHNADTAVTLGVYEGNNVAVDYNNPYDVRASYDPPSLLEYGQTYYWRIDAVSDTNMWKGPVWGFIVLDPRATNPYPTNGDEDVPEAGVQLSWSPGHGASSHDLYLGTNLNDVSDATTSADVYVCKLPLATTSYETGPLEVGRTYYWRVDEQDPCIYPDAWKGHLWQFTVKKWTGIDDFEPYVDDMDLILTWLDGAYFFNGSIVFLAKTTNTPPDPVHGGDQSLGYLYDNTGMGWDVPYYSEVYRDIDYPRDWAVLGADTMRLWFYGDPTNSTADADQMYLGAEDSRGAVSYVEAQYGTMGDLLVAEWQQWDVSVEDFSAAGLNIEDVNKLYIGFGNRSNPAVAGGMGLVYFDDIRLYLPEYPACWDYLTQCHGDCDNTGDVKGSDFLALKNSWYKVYGGPAYDPCADFDRNGEVKGSDFLILKNNWYQTVPADCTQGDINGIY
ncbi:MAG: dockerin type I domain-containing protein, partial [Planctomycetota bacterium]